jgi:hypothetical protein
VLLSRLYPLFDVFGVLLSGALVDLVTALVQRLVDLVVVLAQQILGFIQEAHRVSSPP